MSEHEDIEEFDPEDDFEDEPEEHDYEAARVRAVNDAIAQFERDAGVDLSPEEWNDMGIGITVGMSPEDAYGRTDSGRFEANFEATVEAVEREQGRKLLDGEVDAMWEVAEQAADDPTVETDAQVWAMTKESATNMLDTSDGIAEYIGQRLSVPQERAEASAVTEDETPSFNLDSPDERVAAIDAAMAGETVSTHDNDDLAGDA